MEFWYLRALGPLPPSPYPPQIKCLQSIFWWKCPTCLGCLYPRWFPGNHTSSIRHPLFLLSTISHPAFSSSSCLIFCLCTWNLYLPFVKALAQESEANVGVGQGQDLAKEENLDVARGEMFQGREKESSWDIRWERQYVWSDEGDLSGMQCFYHRQVI